MANKKRKGQIYLEPMIPGDLAWFYDVATNSEGSKYWYGEITGYAVPNLIQFKKDYINAYFSDDHPELGRCFSINDNENRIGVIVYNKIEVWKELRQTEIDIIIAEHANTGKGLGVQAINELTQYLFSKQEVDIIYLSVPVNNPRAYHAYVNAGFKEVKKTAINGKIWLKMELYSENKPGQ